MRVIFYKTASGREPVKDYFEKLSVLDRVRIAEDIEIIEDCNSIEELKTCPVNVKPLQGKLWEIKTGHGNQQRVYYVIISGLQMVLLHACKKQSQKAAQRDIETGMKRMMEVLS